MLTLINIVAHTTNSYILLYLLKYSNMFYKDSIIPWIGKTGKMLGATINKIFKENAISLTREQFIVLKLLMINNGKPQQDLAFITESDKTSLSRLIKNMEDKKYIERNTSREDKRIKTVHITSLGKEVLNSTTPLVEKTILKLQEGISESEIQQTISTIQKIQQNIFKEHSIKL